MNVQNYIEGLISFLKSQLQGAGRGKNPEYVHQTRVTARRLGNVLWVFKARLTSLSYKQCRKNLSALCRGLGSVRDLDVKILFLKKRRHVVRIQVEKLYMAHLIEILTNKRVHAQIQVAAAIDRFEKSKVLPQIEELFSRKEIYEHKLFLLVQRKINKRLKRFLSYRSFVSQPQEIKELHRMRIAAKKLRYTLEIFETLYGQELKKFTLAALSFQDVLGEIHDYAVWPEFLSEMVSKDGGITVHSQKKFKQECLRKRMEAYHKFVRLWRKHEKDRSWHKLKIYLKKVPQK